MSTPEKEPSVQTENMNASDGLNTHKSNETPTTGAQNDPLEQAISELGELRERQTGGASGLNKVLREVPVNLEVLLGRASVSVAEANAFKDGTVVSLDTHVGDDVAIVVGGVEIGTGKVIVSPDDPNYFAVKVTALKSKTV